MKTKTYLWAILTSIMVIAALFFGLRPRNWPNVNDVQWFPDQRTIRFHDTGIAYVDDLRAVRLNDQPGPLTIEMAVTPANTDKIGYRPMLVMHDGADRLQLAVWQYGTSLIVMNGDDYDNSQRRPKVVGRDVFSPQQTRFLTITSGERGTHLYVDGTLADATSKWKLSIPVEGEPLRLVLGHSVYGRNGWRGDLHGLTLAGEAISAEAVRLRFDRWAANRHFGTLKLDSTMLLFTFSEKTDGGFVDESGGNQTLELPAHMTVLKKTFLSSPRPDIYWRRAVTSDMVVNVVGFVPLGIVFYGFLHCFSGRFTRQKQLIAVALCLMLSLGIELAQSWIPTRYSSLPDLILNTFGAWLGVVGWKLVHKSVKPTVPIKRS